MRCILHIGTEKTGTTSVQDTLQKNFAQLQAEGFLYPRVLHGSNHPKIAVYAMNDDAMDSRKRRFELLDQERIDAFRAGFEQQLAAEITGAQHTALIVNEHLSRLRHPEELERLRDLLGRHFDEVQVVLYLRRQDKLLRSMYSTIIKVGGDRREVYPEWTGAPEGDFITFDYDRIATLWAGVFGAERLKVRIFERDQLHNGDAVEDYLSIAGWGERPALETVRSNESLNMAAILAVREMNARFAPEDRANIGLIAGRLFPGGGPTVTDAEAREFLSHFEEGNRAVARRHFGREVLFDPIADGEYGDAVSASTASPTMGELADVMAQLWVEKGRAYGDLERKFTRLRRMQRQDATRLDEAGAKLGRLAKTIAKLKAQNAALEAKLAAASDKSADAAPAAAAPTEDAAKQAG